MELLKVSGKFLIVLGLVLIICGFILVSGFKVPYWLGRLPGDIHIKQRTFSFYFPFTTCVVISLILSLIFWLLGKK